MAGGGVTVRGGPETAHAFDGLRDDVANLEATHHKVAQARLAGVARRTPVRTGELAGSWAAEGSTTGGSIVSPLAYAPVIEYGSAERGITAARMVRDTLEAETGELLEEYRAGILEAAKRRGFRVA